MNYSKLSIKTFIGDFPRIINGNFEMILGVFEKLLGTATSDLELYTKSLNASGTITANTVKVNNDVLITVNNKTVSLADVIKQLQDSNIIE